MNMASNQVSNMSFISTVFARYSNNVFNFFFAQRFYALCHKNYFLKLLHPWFTKWIHMKRNEGCPMS